MDEAGLVIRPRAEPAQKCPFREQSRIAGPAGAIASAAGAGTSEACRQVVRQICRASTVVR